MSPSPHSMMADRLLPTTTTTSPEQRQHQLQVPLKCPRCESSHTKFCYYNNYSLSQPRHFCKACKRYWTRGGTLRNVPVGGGCRKNKTAKKPSATSRSDTDATTPVPTATNNLNSFSYGLDAVATHQLVGNDTRGWGFASDLRPPLNALDLELPHNRLPNAGFVDDYLAQLQLPVTTSVSSILQDYPRLGSSFPGTTELQASSGMNLGLMKDVKMEGLGINGMGGDRIGWQIPCENSYGTVSALARGDSSFVYWNHSSSWPEAANCGSSVTHPI